MRKILRNIGVVMGMVVNGTYANFDGIYAGASLGYMNQSTSIDASQNPENNNADTYKATMQSGRPTAEIFMGWGQVLGKFFYGGLEGKMDVLLGQSQKIAEDTNFIYKSNRKGLGIAALMRLGYLLTPTTLIYGGAGVKVLQFNHNLFEKTGKIPSLFSQRATNLLTELGVETVIGTSRQLRFRFTYAFMPRKSMIRTTSQFPVDHVYRDRGVLKVGGAEHALKMGVIYRF